MARLQHPFSGVAFTDWLRLVVAHGGVAPAAWPAALAITWRSLVATGTRQREHRRFERAVREQTIDQPPLFLLGHWRSGTTLLENILCRDPAAGYLSVVQSIHPLTFLTAEDDHSRRFVATKRYMDNVRLTADSPSEEEVAMAVLAPGSFWHGYYFPSRLDEYFEKYLLFDGIHDDELAAWKDAYRYLLKKLTLRHGGKRLFLKNPPNTARIAVLLEMFPDAKFVHIHRNPYEVYLSRMAQYGTAVVRKALQRISESEWREKVLDYYRRMMARHLELRDQIPNGHYIEMRFDDLRRRPLPEIERLYHELDLGGWDAAQKPISDYVDSLAGYRQNTYHLDEDIADEIYQHWHQTIDLWGYEVPRLRTDG